MLRLRRCGPICGHPESGAPRYPVEAHFGPPATPGRSTGTMSYPTPEQPHDWQAPADPYQTHGMPPPAQPGGYPPPYGYGYGVPMAPPTNPLAITSLVLSCVGV